MADPLPTGCCFAGPCRLLVIVATAAGSILMADCARSGSPPAVDARGAAQSAAPGPCEPDAPYLTPADLATGLAWRLLPCTRRQAGADCGACATCGSGAWCAPAKTRGMGPRSPGGGPDD